jgi:hypothetical protein
LKLLFRLIWVAIAAALSVLAGLAFVLVLGLEWLTASLQASGADGVGRWIDGADTIMPAISRFMELGTVLGVALAPGLAVLIIAEVARIRSLTYYLAGGGVAFAAVPAMMRWSEATAPAGGPPHALWQTPVVLLVATGGFLAGAVYWGLAGRRA